MGYIIGSGVGLVTCVFARAVGFDRDRAFYPTTMSTVGPAFCGSFDIAMPVCLVWLWSTGRWLTKRPAVSGSTVE